MNIVSEMGKTFIVAKYTFLEIIKSKILINVVLLGIGLALVCYLASTFTYGVPQRVALDVGLGTISLSSVAMAILLGVGLISKEIENRTIHMVLSRPLSRASFLIGKILGMAGVLFLNILILGVMTFAIYKFLGGEFESLIAWAFLFVIFEAFLVLLVVVFFSLLTNPTLSVIFTASVFIAGHAVTEAKLILFAKHSVAIDLLLRIFGFIIPNFHKLNLKGFVLYHQSLPDNFLIGAGSYALIYMVFLTVVSALIFSRKNLD